MSNPNFLTASIGRRLAALLYDSFILLALSFTYGALLTLIGVLSGLTAQDYQPMFRHWLFPLGWLLTLQIFYYWFWRRSGQTLGMRTWRIRLYNAAQEDAPVSPRQCLIRALITPPLILLGGLAYWYRFFNANGDCLQDVISGTRVLLIPKK
jgi:uncharacterized RDD family membrane protein YckC